MRELINKVTLYDIISFIVPGGIILLCVFIGIVPSQALLFINSLSNSWFVGILFIILSYCVGWTISELGKYIIKFYELNKSISSRQIMLIIKIGLIIGLVLSLWLLEYTKLKILIVFILFSVFVIYNIFVKKMASDYRTDEYKVLIRTCNEYLKKLYPDYDRIFCTKFEKAKSVEAMSKSSFMLIQTDSKYSRLHNYSSSKSFSKNLSIVSFLLSINFSYQFCFETNSKFSYIYFFMILILLLSSIALYRRYKSFENKLNILTATFFIDYAREKLKG